MKKIRAVLCLLLSLLLALTLVSCGQKDVEESEEDEPKTKKSRIAEEKDTEDQGGNDADDHNGNDASPPADGTARTDGVKVIRYQLTNEQYAIGVEKGNEELLAKTNEYLAKIKEDGTLEKIVKKFFCNEGEPTVVKSAAQDASGDQLVVATNAQFPPFESTSGDGYVGIDIEIMAGLAEYLGKELVILDVAFDSVLLQVDSGKADVVAAGLTVNAEREKLADFSEPYYTASQVVIAPESDRTFDGCMSAEDVESILKGFDRSTVIGVQKAVTGQYYVEGSEDWGFEGYPCTCMLYYYGSQAVQDMINGSVRYVILDETPAGMIAASFGGEKK